MARDNAARFTFSTVPNAWSSVTLNVGAVHTATTPAVAPPNGTVVTFASLGTPAVGPGLAINTTYYVVNSSGTSFGISQVLNGAPIVLTTASGAIAMATVSLTSVVTTLGGRSAGFKFPSGPSGHWSTGYSDALNVTRFRTTIADISVMTNQVVQSGIVGDPPLNSSTSEGNYYLRASVGLAGVVGPVSSQLIVQGAGTNSATAPAQGDFDWQQVSTVSLVAPNATQLQITISTATGGFTVNAGSVVQGQTFVPHTTAGNLTAGVQYLVGPSNILYTTAGVALSGLTATTLVYGYVGTFSPFGTFTTATAAASQSLVVLDTAPPAGCALVFTSITGGTGVFAANTTYFVVPTGIAGQFGLSATFNGAPLVNGATALTAGAGFWTCVDKQPYLYVSNTTTGNVFTSVVGVGGTQAAPHGLEVGDVVYLFSGSGTGLVADQPVYVISTPSATTFTVSATINGAILTVSASSVVFAPVRVFKIHNAQVDKTTRPWMRVALQTLNGAYLQTGYAQIMFADLAIGKDNSVVS